MIAAEPRPLTSPVQAFSVVAIAVLLAATSLLGQRARQGALLANAVAAERASRRRIAAQQVESSDQVIDLIQVGRFGGGTIGAEIEEKYARRLDRAKTELKAAEDEVQKAEAELQRSTTVADRLDLGLALLEAALLLCAISLLADRTTFWTFGLALGGLGVASAASSLVARLVP